jgi:hypothetical protein
MVEGYRSAIGFLARDGLVDRCRIGVIGCSRTAYYVKYALTHYPYLFRAAVIADGVDYSYGQFFNTVDWVESSYPLQYKATYGGSIMGASRNWLRDAPDLRAEAVRIPVRIEATSGLASIFMEWPFYSGMRRHGLPVDLVAYPKGAHLLFNPIQRFASTTGTLNWFEFWLQDKAPNLPEVDRQRWGLLKEYTPPYRCN